MVDSLLNLIFEGSSKDFIRRVELDVREMVVRMERREKGKLDRRTEACLGEE